MRGLIVLILVLAFMAGCASRADAHRLSGRPASARAQLELARRQVQHDRAALAGARAQGWISVAIAAGHLAWLERDRAHVRRLELALTRPAWLVRAFLCIHSREGAWNDPDPPFWGGLQMDAGFMATYGADLLRRKGTADHWTPDEQIAVAIRAYNSGRGFYPWPNTARACGLI